MEGTYLLNGHALSMLARGKRGGARLGAGRPRIHPKKEKPATGLCLSCGDAFERVKNTRHCQACAARRKALKDYAGCSHEKPKFANGKERKFCFDCSPKPPKRPRKVWQPENVEQRVCAHCETSFAARMPTAKYCGESCGNAANNQKQAERIAATRRDIPCEFCGALFRSGRRKKFCSGDCGTRHQYAAKNGHTHYRRARRYGCAYEPVDRLIVFKRCRWICRACGCRTPRTLLGSQHGDAPVLDHIVPMARGGAHAYSNVHLLCRTCNHLKGTSTMEEFLLWMRTCPA